MSNTIGRILTWYLRRHVVLGDGLQPLVTVVGRHIYVTIEPVDGS